MITPLFYLSSFPGFQGAALDTGSCTHTPTSLSPRWFKLYEEGPPSSMDASFEAKESGTPSSFGDTSPNLFLISNSSSIMKFPLLMITVASLASVPALAGVASTSGFSPLIFRHALAAASEWTAGTSATLDLAFNAPTAPSAAPTWPATALTASTTCTTVTKGDGRAATAVLAAPAPVATDLRWAKMRILTIATDLDILPSCIDFGGVASGVFSSFTRSLEVLGFGLIIPIFEDQTWLPPASLASPFAFFGRAPKEGVLVVDFEGFALAAFRHDVGVGRVRDGVVVPGAVDAEVDERLSGQGDRHQLAPAARGGGVAHPELNDSFAWCPNWMAPIVPDLASRYELLSESIEGPPPVALADLFTTPTSAPRPELPSAVHWVATLLNATGPHPGGAT
ncbi:hypothetical protein BDK51DRAFT_49262 [Blyttiomyces helicus]|uniref:Uncharacterized protein n=1 Tax=Blyttiomyces helicus TaxID=388810 RepID=A0A4P9WA15_9FUNG|nr:hypothetical protein BDK51DRAFT_49262 [Blyttiomyces helicus]|eukprot:RKO88365.1 hypothetical protein BDK51DRAFT_49262 [Blyttiomyces helicus]